jgi:ribose-phosphate pyrophosphokinase
MTRRILLLFALLASLAGAANGAPDTVRKGRTAALVLGSNGATRGFKFERFSIGEGRVALQREVAGRRVNVQVGFPRQEPASHLFKIFQVVRTAWSERARSIDVHLDSRFHETFGKDAFLHDMLKSVGAEGVQFADGIPAAPAKDSHVEISSRPPPRRSAKSLLGKGSSIWGTHVGDRLVEGVSNELDAAALPLEHAVGRGGDVDVKLPEDPRDKDIFLMHTRSTSGEGTHEELLRTLRTAWTAKKAGAKKVTLVMPYLVYSRSDRKVIGGTDVGIATMARLIKASGVDQIVTVSIHQPQEIGIFEALDMRVVHMSGERVLAQRASQLLKSHAGRLFIKANGPEEEARARTVASKLAAQLGVADVPVKVEPFTKGAAPVAIGGLAVLAPDAGAGKRAKMFARLIAENLGLPRPSDVIDVLVASKTRSADGKTTKTTFDGDVKDRVVIAIDDETATGGTMHDLAEAANDHGAAVQIAAVSHLMGDAASKLSKSQHLDRLLVTDTVPKTTQNLSSSSKIEVVSLSKSLAGVVKALDRGQSTRPWAYIEQVE